MELRELYDKLISEGCNHFYIDGVGGPHSDDVEHLGETDGVWEVYYTERGVKSDPLFSTRDKDVAIKYYLDHVLSIEHWHLVAFTRSSEILDSYRHQLEAAGLRTIQNDIPSYAVRGDRVLRLFVTNKDIFRAREILEVVPHVDDDLRV